MKILSFILFIVFLEACNQSIAEEVVYDDKRIWKLEWALINSLLLEDSIRARLFFDTLVSSKKPIGELFLLEGLSLYPSSDSSKSIQILCNQPDSIVALHMNAGNLVAGLFSPYSVYDADLGTILSGVSLL